MKHRPTHQQIGIITYTPMTTPEQAEKMFTLDLVNYSRMFRKYGEENSEQCKNIEAEIYRRVMGTDRGDK